MTAWDEIVEFNNRFFPGWRQKELVYLSNALAGEVGEICSVVKRMAGGGTNLHKHSPPTKEELLEEVADLYVYLVLMTEGLGADERRFMGAVARKMEKNRQRLQERQS